jgi:hypothetical protein
MSQSFIYKPLLFVLLIVLTPSVDAVMFFYQSEELGFSPGTIATIATLISAANVLGILTYNIWLKKVNFRTIIVWATILFCVANSLFLLQIWGLTAKLHIPHWLYFGFTSCLYAFMNEVHLMALMIMAVKVCPKEVEATVFEVIMATINLSYLISYESGGLISKLLHVDATNFSNLWI